MIRTTIQGIPCIVEETHIYYTKPSFKPACLCDSPSEFYGDYEVEFDVFDRKGYRAAWLERKMTDKDRERIEQEILDDYRRGPDGD